MSKSLWVKVCQLYAKLKDMPKSRVEIRHLKFAKNLYDNLDPNDPTGELSNKQIKHLENLWKLYLLNKREHYEDWS